MLASKKQEEERLASEKKEFEETLKAETSRTIEDEEESSEEEEQEKEQDEQQQQQQQKQQEKSTASSVAEKDETEEITDTLKDTQLSSEKAQEQQLEELEEERIRIRTTTDLLDLLIAETPKIKDEDDEEEEGEPKVVIGLVGYPNVGKSSTINALIGEKRVSVSSTPGKTKHFQTIHLTPKLVLCDCPGLVFPTFSTTKADQVCNGVLPIDQLREHTGPTALVAQRIPKGVLEATYGIRIRTQPKEDGGTGIPTSSELCTAYASKLHGDIYEKSAGT